MRATSAWLIPLALIASSAAGTIAAQVQAPAPSPEATILDWWLRVRPERPRRALAARTRGPCLSGPSVTVPIARAIDRTEARFWAMTLEDPYAMTRRGAMHTLARARWPNTVGLLFPRLVRDPENAAVATRVLARLGVPPSRLAETLAPMLRDADATTRRGAAAALGWLFEDASSALEPLLAGTRDPDAGARAAATVAVARIGAADRLDIARLLADPDLDVRRAATRATHRLRRLPVAAVDGLQDAIRSGDRVLRIEAVRALGALPDASPFLQRTVAALDLAARSDRPEERVEVRRSLRRLGDRPGVREVLARAYDAQARDAWRTRYALGIDEPQSPPRPFVIADLSSDESATRAAALARLAKMRVPPRTPPVADAVVAAIAAPDPVVRALAFRVVAEQGIVDPRVAIRAAHDALADPDERVRGASVRALTALDAGLADRQRLARDATGALRVLATWSLGQTPDASSLPVLTAAATGDDVQLQEVALDALARFASIDDATHTALETVPLERNLAISFARVVPEHVRAWCEARLQRPHGYIVTRAIAALRVHPADRVHLLVGIAEGRWPAGEGASVSVRKSAIVALSAITCVAPAPPRGRGRRVRLDPAVALAVPAVTRLANDERLCSDASRFLALFPPLLWAHGVDPITLAKHGGDRALARMGPAAEPAVDLLIARFDGTSWLPVPVAERWIRLLGSIGPAARRAIPVLESLCDDPAVGATALRALARVAVGREDRGAALVFLRQFLERRSSLGSGATSDDALLRAAIGAIQALAPDSAPARRDAERVEAWLDR